MLDTWNESIFSNIKNRLQDSAMKLVHAERLGEAFDSQLVIGVRESYGEKNWDTPVSSLCLDPAGDVWRFCLSSHRSEKVENMTAREWQRSSFWFQQLGIEAEASCSTWQTLFMNAQQLEMVCFTPFGLPEILFVLYILKSWVTPHFFVFLRFCNQNNDLNAPNILTLYGDVHTYSGIFENAVLLCLAFVLLFFNHLTLTFESLKLKKLYCISLCDDFYCPEQ